MSDTNVAPDAGAGGGSPAPASQPEVVINPNPTNTQEPIGSQAPPKPPDRDAGSKDTNAKDPAESRMAAIKRAFARAQDIQDRPGPAKPKIGHNNPPEPIDNERPTSLDLKKRPGDQPRVQGRFSKADADHTTGSPVSLSGSVQTAQEKRPEWASVAPLPQEAPYREPLPRMTPQARAEWAAAPESVRSEVHRMHHEFTRAYQQYRGAAEAMEPIRPYHELARQQGTTLDKALSNYVSIEQKLRADPIGGLATIVSNLNLRTPEGHKLELPDLAYHVLQQTPDQHQARQTQQQTGAIAQQLTALQQQNALLAQHMQQMQYERRFHQTRSGVDQFADSHPRFDELAPDIQRELKFGFDLESAYRRAAALRPDTAAQTRSTSTTTPAQTRPTDRSISGAPDAGPSNGTSRANGQKKPVGRRDALARAFKHVNGAL